MFAIFRFDGHSSLRAVSIPFSFVVLLRVIRAKNEETKECGVRTSERKCYASLTSDRHRGNDT